MSGIDGKKIVILKGCEGGDIMLIDPHELSKALHQHYDDVTAMLIVAGMNAKAHDFHGIKIIPIGG